MSLIPIDRLRVQLKLKHLMDLFRIDWAINKIKHLKFFVMGEIRELVQESDGQVYYKSEHPLGIGSCKVLLTETTAKALHILKSEFLKLFGLKESIKPKGTTQTQSKSGINGQFWLGLAFVSSAIGLVGWRAYQKFGTE